MRFLAAAAALLTVCLPSCPQAVIGRGLNFTNITNYPPLPNVPVDSLRIWWNVSGNGVSWAQINTASGVFNWTGLDAWVAKAKTKDILYTFGRVPAWAGGGSDFYGPPSDVDTTDSTWKAFVTALVTRYTGKITSYELWNEPDIMWDGTPAQLVTMARDAFTIIRAIDPAAKIVGPSPSTSNQYGVHFLPAYYAAGGAPYQDVVGCHFYLYTGVGSQRPRTPDALLPASISALKKLMAQYNLSGEDIWFTEGGYGEQSDFSPPLTDAESSHWVTSAYAIMQAAGVKRAYWYSYDNQVWGTLETNNALTAAGVAFAALPAPVPRAPALLKIAGTT